MYQAIQGKVLPVTTNKPTRIKIWCQAGTVTRSIHSFDDPNIRYADMFEVMAWEFMAKMNWPGVPVCGVLPGGDWVAVQSVTKGKKQ